MITEFVVSEQLLVQRGSTAAGDITKNLVETEKPAVLYMQLVSWLH